MSDKSVFKDLPSVLDTTAIELEKHPSEWEIHLQTSDENDTSEAAQDRLLPSPNHEKNKQLITKGRKKRKLQSGGTGEEKEERLEEQIKIKSVLGVTKVLKDRVQRRKTKVKERDNEDLLKSLTELHPEIVSSLENIQKTWPLRPDLQNINEEIKKIEQKVKADDTGNMKATEEMKPRLLEIGKMIESFDEKIKKNSVKVRSIEDYFIEGARVETLREKLYSEFPEIAQEEIARSTTNQDQESLQTCEQLQNSLKYSNENFAQHNNEGGDAFPYAQDAGATPTIFDQGTPVGGECDPSFLSNAKYDVCALVSTVPVAHMDYMKTVPYEIKREKLLACLDQMRGWIVALLVHMDAKNARLEVLETAMAEANSTKGSEGLAQNKMKMLEIDPTAERQKVKLFGKLMNDQTRAWNVERTALMTWLNHAEEENRDLKKRLEASGASSSEAPPRGYFRASGSIPPAPFPPEE